MQLETITTMQPTSHSSNHDLSYDTMSPAPGEIFGMKELLDPEKSPLVPAGNGIKAYDEVQEFLKICKSKILKDGKVFFSCLVCQKKFSTYYNMRIHSNKHFKTLKLNCKYCSKSFSDPANLCKHSMYHFDCLKKKLECSHCSKNFATKFHLKRHLFAHDKSLCRFMCSICEFRTATSGELKYHKRIHSEKSISCDQCERTFYSKSDLNTHRMIHSEIRNFTCEICHEEFSRYGNLERHLKVHSSFKFKCISCGAHYANVVGLTRHIKWHKPKTTDAKSQSFPHDVYSMYL